ncbi:DUF2255 family protein [Ruficoccus sp. ZRK36]|uniref:DUF2255 family protein n=1 Tax=Ruficoccus sp. ZRK36 TaxID=2866311 RepID=UPI001C73B830|nr:DUF2255 family protein [Ruficoccus sp. ZRK36]QYY35041.1 DUF2255 family protein [Ruficoccus sp. ZRK36]
MAAWASEDLEKIRLSDDLHIAPFRADGKTYGTPTWIWSVVVDGRLYVRAYNGRASRWYRSAMAQKTGCIHAVGQQWDVTFHPVDDSALNDQIDAAYVDKYEGSPYLLPMVGERTRAATVLILPKDE